MWAAAALPVFRRHPLHGFVLISGVNDSNFRATPLVKSFSRGEIFPTRYTGENPQKILMVHRTRAKISGVLLWLAIVWRVEHKPFQRWMSSDSRVNRGEVVPLSVRAIPKHAWSCFGHSRTNFFDFSASNSPSDSGSRTVVRRFENELNKLSRAPYLLRQAEHELVSSSSTQARVEPKILWVELEPIKLRFDWLNAHP